MNNGKEIQPIIPAVSNNVSIRAPAIHRVQAIITSPGLQCNTHQRVSMSFCLLLC